MGKPAKSRTIYRTNAEILAGVGSGKVDKAGIASFREANIQRKAIEDDEKYEADLVADGRVAAVPPNPSRDARKQFGFSQEEFAKNFGLSLRTVQDWEQGRSKPDIAASTLLEVIRNNPNAVILTVARRKRLEPKLIKDAAALLRDGRES